jgi:2C-methyl-D-erythritol 2,4-cyclodiphosphate synthase
VICEKPRLAPFIEIICKTLEAQGIEGVNVKAKTNEGMGFIGRGEGMAAFAVATLIRKS